MANSVAGSVWQWQLVFVSSVLFLLGLCNAADMGEICRPSSCGNLHNISYPFRLEGDPISCGEPFYEFSCENNRTVFRTDSIKLYVEEISYEEGNRTIRVVDYSLGRDNCTSLPNNPLGASFRSSSYISTSSGREMIYPYPFFWDSTSILDITFVNCSAPINDNPYYVAIKSCFNSSSYPNFYMIMRSKAPVAELNGSCITKGSGSVAVERLSHLGYNATTLDGAPKNKKLNLSYTDIHDALLMGIYLHWDLPDQRQVLSVRTGKRILQTVVHHMFDLFVQCLPVLGRIMIARTSTGVFCLAVLLSYMLWRERLSKNEKAKMMVSKYKSHVQKMTSHFKEALQDTVREFLTKHGSKDENIEEFLNNYRDHVPTRYSYFEVKKMTRGFKEKLGQGGYGSVYKGELPNGHPVAVKMLNKSKGNGQEFINEVATIGRIHHINIVQLIGFCSKGSKRALIYDFMPNGSLDKYIFSQGEISPLSWEKLYDISLGIARGIEYLHRGCDMQILHFDIKPHNILLDNNFTPKVSDFGLAKFYPTQQSIVSVTAARGTIGYMAPELFYRNVGRVSYKSDVYSFGMLLMEMAGRRKNINANAENSSQIYFPSWIYDQLNQGRDVRIMQEVTPDEKEMAKKLIIVALWCIQMKPIDRPSMSKVVEMLGGRLELLRMPPKPFLSPQQVTEEDGSSTSVHNYQQLSN